MLVTGQKITAYRIENLNTQHGAKTTRHFLLDYSHSNVYSANIVGTRDDLIVDLALAIDSTTATLLGTGFTTPGSSFSLRNDRYTVTDSALDGG